jgi:hypothetical protein
MAKKKIKVRVKRKAKVDTRKYLEKTGRKGGSDGPTHRFKKGNPGKPKGAKDKSPVSRAQRASVKALIEELVLDHPTEIRKAIVDGIKGGARHADRYVRLVTEYTDGKPVDTLNINPWRQDEVEAAHRTLEKKFEGVLAAIIKRRANAAVDGSAGGDSSDAGVDREAVVEGDREDTTEAGR